MYSTFTILPKTTTVHCVTVVGIIAATRASPFPWLRGTFRSFLISSICLRGPNFGITSSRPAATQSKWILLLTHWINLVICIGYLIDCHMDQLWNSVRFFRRTRWIFARTTLIDEHEIKYGYIFTNTHIQIYLNINQNCYMWRIICFTAHLNVIGHDGCWGCIYSKMAQALRNTSLDDWQWPLNTHGRGGIYVTSYYLDIYLLCINYTR